MKFSIYTMLLDEEQNEQAFSKAAASWRIPFGLLVTKIILSLYINIACKLE